MALPAFAEWTEAGLAETLVIERLEGDLTPHGPGRPTARDLTSVSQQRC